MSRSGWLKAYAVTVSFSTALWWALILSFPQVKSLFLWHGLPETALLSFLPADLLFFIVLPLVWSVRQTNGLWNAHRFAAHYAAITTLSLSLIAEGAWAGTALMVGASIGAEVVAQPFKVPTAAIEAKPSSITHNILKTLAQVVVMWSIFLLFLPKAISEIETLVGVPKLPAVPVYVPWLVFCGAGSTGIYTALLFAIHGRGTPLPLDATTRFLVLGPYRYIRNPMATLGVVQVICVALLYRSPLVVTYGFVGAMLWSRFACPWEEADLEARFGQEYADYRKAVHNWVPRLRPYQKVVVERVG